MAKKVLALFDFDGTITTKDTLIEFIKYYHGDKNFLKGMIKLSPMLILYKLKFIKNSIAKEKMISYFFKDEFEDSLNQKAYKFTNEILPKLLRKEMLEKIEFHKNSSHEIAIVSASMSHWIKPWSSKLELKLISTELEIKDFKITGKFKTKNCYGIEKVNRIKELYNLDEFDYIYSYGDSNGDKAMLDLANERYYKGKKV